MGESVTNATTTPPSNSLHRASRTLIASAVFAVPVGLFTWVYPPAVDETVWGYPFDKGPVVAVSAVLVVAHLLKTHGFLGLSRLRGGGPVVQWSMILAALGFAIVALCEVFSAVLWGVPIDSPEAVNLNNGYGAGSMLLAIPSMVGGAVIVRRKLLPGFGRWSVFLSGAFMVFVVTPALIMGRGPAAYLTLTGWSLFYVWIGRVLARAEAD